MIFLCVVKVFNTLCEIEKRSYRDLEVLQALQKSVYLGVEWFRACEHQAFVRLLGGFIVLFLSEAGYHRIWQV